AGTRATRRLQRPAHDVAPRRRALVLDARPLSRSAARSVRRRRHGRSCAGLREEVPPLRRSASRPANREAAVRYPADRRRSPFPPVRRGGRHGWRRRGHAPAPPPLLGGGGGQRTPAGENRRPGYGAAPAPPDGSPLPRRPLPPRLRPRAGAEHGGAPDPCHGATVLFGADRSAGDGMDRAAPDRLLHLASA